MTSTLFVLVLQQTYSRSDRKMHIQFMFDMLQVRRPFLSGSISLVIFKDAVSCIFAWRRYRLTYQDELCC